MSSPKIPNKGRLAFVLPWAMHFPLSTVNIQLLHKPLPPKEIKLCQRCVAKTAHYHPTTQARCDATSIQDIPKPCACAKAHDPTPSCCRPNCRAIRPRPAEIEFTWYYAVISFTFGFLEGDLFLLMARIPVFGFPCAWSAAPHHGGFRWEFASVVGPGAGDLSRPTPLSISSNGSSSTSTSITTTCMCGIYSVHGRCGM